MGVDYSAKMIYGLPSEEVRELLEYSDEDGDYAFYNKGLDRVSPYYDSDPDSWVIGATIAFSYDYTPTEIDLNDIPEALEQAKKKFFEVTGKEGRLYISPHGS